MEAIYSVMVQKQEQIIRVQREIHLLKEHIRRQEVEGQIEAPRLHEGASQFFAMLLCGLLIGALIGLAMISHSSAQAIRWDQEEQRVMVYDK
jgi:hypothetical protein